MKKQRNLKQKGLVKNKVLWHFKAIILAAGYKIIFNKREISIIVNIFKELKCEGKNARNHLSKRINYMSSTKKYDTILISRS